MMKNKVVTEQGIEIQFYEVKNSKKQKRYELHLNIMKIYYYCIGVMPYNEMKKILKYLIILNN